MSGEAAEHIHDLRILLRISGQLAGGVGLQQSQGELGSGNLETDLGQLGGIVFTNVVREMVLEMRKLELAFLFVAPFLVSAASLPVGDVAFSGLNLEFFESTDDLAVGSVVVEHAIDHVALEFGQTGDFAVADVGRDARGRMLEGSSAMQGACCWKVGRLESWNGGMAVAED